MRDRLEVGVAGCGWIARQVHLPLLRQRSDVRLAALADSDAAALGEAARQVPGARTYAQVTDMLASETLDAVVVALPPALHSPASCAVFEAGAHLYLEKPIATTLDESTAIMRAWHRSGRVGMMGFNCRGNPLYATLRDLMRAGRAGQIVYLRTFFSTAARAHPGWKRERASGGGALLDLGVHHIDLIRFVTGREITAVRATVSSRASEHDTALLECQLEGGISTHSFFSLAAAEGDHVEVHGDQARLSVARYASLDVEVVDNPGRGLGVIGRSLRRVTALRNLPRAVRARRAPLREPGYALLLDRFVRECRSPSAPSYAPSIADGYAAAAVVAAAEHSLTSGQMEVPESFVESLHPAVQSVSSTRPGQP